MQCVDSSEIQGPYGEGHHGCISSPRPEERHRPAEHGMSLVVTFMHVRELLMTISSCTCLAGILQLSFNRSFVEHTVLPRVRCEKL